MSDLDFPPASDDPDVQTYLDIQWREAQRAAREGRECLRLVWPDLTQHITETGARHLHAALTAFESASNSLNLAGKHIMGEEAFDEYIQTLTTRKVNDTTRRST